MKLFQCQACEQIVYFENSHCERCGHSLGYAPARNTIFALEPDGDHWRSVGDVPQAFRFCANAAYGSCNWLIPHDAKDDFCAACRHNHTVPDLSREQNLVLWRQIETAKHRLFYSLLRYRLPLKTRLEDPVHGLAFDFPAGEAGSAKPKVLTGHDHGVITIALEEADDAERERRRTALREPYRTLLGHFRHEVGHYFWDILICTNPERLAACRALFGDDTQDYAQALARHYDHGPPADWQNNYISAYAASHPWEDWAETWAHYLHIVDSLEMARAFGIRVKPRIDTDETLAATVDINPFAVSDFSTMIDAWLPLVFAVNSLNRAMGNADLYPFVLSPVAISKLAFVHRTILNASSFQPTELST